MGYIVYKKEFQSYISESTIDCKTWAKAALDNPWYLSMVGCSKDLRTMTLAVSACPSVFELSGLHHKPEDISEGCF